MSSYDGNSIVKDNGSHVCSAQSDSVSSLQFDKRVKYRSYSSQFTLADQILVGVDRREEIRPIENRVTIEVDLCCGFCNDTKTSKYSMSIRLEKMSNENPWVNKLVTYDTFVDKDVLKSIRDDAMEPNKLYLLKHQHKEHKNTSEGHGRPEKRQLRDTAAQYNPSFYGINRNIDTLVFPSNDADISVGIPPSKNTLRNELIVCTGINQYPVEINEQFSSSISIDLATHELPNSQCINKPNNVNEYSPLQQGIVEVVLLDPKIQNTEKINQDKHDLILMNEQNPVDDIPFAEETDNSENDLLNSGRDKLSKSLQYYLPVFETNQQNAKDNDIFNSCRDEVSTDEDDTSDRSYDESESMEKDNSQSINPDDYNELSKSMNSLTCINDQEFSIIQQGKDLMDYDDTVDYDNIIIQENLVIHIHPEVQDTISIGDLDLTQKSDIRTNFPFTELDDISIDLSVEQQKYYHNNLNNDELIGEPESFEFPSNEEVFQTERDSFESQSSMVSKDLSNEDDSSIFSKSKSFDLKRNSCKKEEDILNNLTLEASPFVMRHPIYNQLKGVEIDLDQISSSSIQPGRPLPRKNDIVPTINRQEKFIDNDLNLFNKPSSNTPATVSNDNHRGSLSSEEENTKSSQKNDNSIQSSENSMIIKDIPNDYDNVSDRYPNYDIKESVQEEDETENMSTDDISNYENLNTMSTEEIPDKEEQDDSSNDGQSFYSATTTSTVNEIMLRDLVKTPIDSAPGKFEKFLEERSKRNIKETKDKVKPSGTNDVLMDKPNKDESESHIITTTESTYTDDTSSSSSDFPEIPKTQMPATQNKENKVFSSTSEDNMSIKDLDKPNLLNGNLSSKDEIISSDESESTTVTSDEDLSQKDEDSVPLVHHNHNIKENAPMNVQPQLKHKISSSSSSSYSNSSGLIATSSDNSISIKKLDPANSQSINYSNTNEPLSNNDKHIPQMDDVSSSESDSLSSQSSSASLDQFSAKKIETKDNKLVNIQFNNKLNPPPVPKKRMTSTSSSNRSASNCSKNENKLENQSPFIERSEKDLTQKPKLKQKPLKNTQNPYSRLSNASDSDESTSSSSEDIRPEQLTQRKPIEVQKMDEQKRPLNSTRNNALEKPQSSSSSDSSTSLSTSSENITSQTNNQWKSLDRESKEASSFVRQQSVPIPKLRTSISSKSYSTSTEEPSPIIKIQQRAPIIKEKSERPHIINVSKQKSPNRSSDESSYSDSTDSISTSSDDQNQSKKGAQAKDTKPIKPLVNDVSKTTPTNSYSSRSQKLNSKTDVLPTNENKSINSSSNSVSLENDAPINENIVPPPALSIDRREKFMKGIKPSINGPVKRSASVPNYLHDSSSTSISTSDEDASHELEKKPLSQSVKSVNDESKIKKIHPNQKSTSYELMSVVLKDHGEKPVTPSIDRREKFLHGKNADKIVSYKNKNDDPKHSDSDYSIDTSSSSDSDESHHAKIEVPLVKDSSENSHASDSEKESIDDFEQEELKIHLENNFDKQHLPGEDKVIESEPIKNDVKQNDQLRDDENEEESLSISSSEYLSASTDDEEKPMELDHYTNNVEPNNNKENPSKNIDHLEKFSNLQENNHQIFKRRTKDDSFSSTSTNSDSTSSGHKANSKSIDRREKFAVKDMENICIGKPLSRPDPPQSIEHDSSSMSVSSSSHSSSKNKTPNSKINYSNEKLNNRDFPSKDHEEKFQNQSQERIKHQLRKNKSDSTDEDISFSLTSVPKESSKPVENSKQNPDRSLSLSSSSTASGDHNLKKAKYEKNKKPESRSYQTLPVINVAKDIPIREKSKSLETKLINIDLPPLNHNLAGSADVIESRYHEYTEKWSRQSPINRDKVQKPATKPTAEKYSDDKTQRTQKKPKVDRDHISAIKNTDTFMKRKLCGPLTDRPRPVPSYLSPVNIIPYIPSDPEFGSIDSLDNDYSSDNSAEEIQPKYKSLPDFITSLSTTSLKKAPVVVKTPQVKKPPTKPKTKVEYINLDYGDFGDVKKPPTKPLHRNESFNSVTTDSSYLERPIFKGNKPNRATPDISSSLSTLSSMKPPKNPKPISKLPPKPHIPVPTLKNEDVSSLSSSTESYTPKESNTQSLTKISNPSSLKNHINNHPMSKDEYLKKSNSLPKKRIPSTSESSEFSSSSDDENIKIYQF